MAKLGRNDPCPCGSGKKYKRCCQDKLKAPANSPTGHLIQPQADVIKREADPQIAALSNWMADTLDGCVNYGSHVSVMISDHPLGGYTDGTVGAIFRHFLEVVDGISVLIRQTCADAAKPLMRTAIEASLSLQYILEADMTRRALAYQVAHAHRRISMHLNLDGTTQQGASFRGKVKNDHFASPILGMDPVMLQARVASLKKMLARPEFAPIEAEWQQAKKKDWYSLFGGPQSFEALAQHLGWGAGYEILYRQWSEAVHGTGALSRFTIGTGGSGALLGLRYPGDLQTLTLHACTMIIYLMRCVIRKYVPADEVKFSQWYVEAISPIIKTLSGPKIITITP